MSTFQNKQWSRQDLEENISQGLDLVEAKLADPPGHSRDLVDDLVQHLSRAGGKRMRPALVVLCAHLGDRGITEQGINPDVVRAALSMELTHLATLYHDDVMDSAPTRRGVQAAHKVWGNNRAVLAGDLVFAWASKEVAQLGSEAVLEHAETFDRLCRGQINESFGPEKGQDPVQFYLQVLADKTGSLVCQSARFGALVSGAGLPVAQLVGEFGEQVGVAFQLVDDVIDLNSEYAVSGKTPGTDLREGIDTMPTLLLEQRERQGVLDADGALILERWRSADALQDDRVLAETVELIRRHPVLQETRQEALAWVGRAKQTVGALDNQVVRQALSEFADSLVDRIA